MAWNKDTKGISFFTPANYVVPAFCQLEITVVSDFARPPVLLRALFYSGR